ncbi:MAG TPA: RidA family protein [Gemmatimonadaceae bacterium]|jgi:2-iminobutanoate/2-iminopropanoate deaminase|nr:RidA family protein [Gemmatimonadaceae bacterium]
MRLTSVSLRLTLIVAAVVVPSIAAAQKQVIVPPGMQASATLSPGTRAGDIVYTSGQLGVSRDTADNTIQAQTKRSLESVQKVVEAAGSSMANVLKCTVFLTDVKDFQGMNSAYTQFFPKEPPARSTVVVAALVSAAAKVEIECIAAAK